MAHDAVDGSDGDEQYDVAVYGGVPGGIAAAVAARRQGVRVLLIEPTRHVGGLSTSGINTAESEHMLRWTIGGFALEFYRRLGEHYGTGQPEFYFESSIAEAVYLDLLREAGVEVKFGAAVGAAVGAVEKHGPHIQSITLTNNETIHASVFVDASYEGDLMAQAGVAYAVGRESRDEFDEDLAGIRFDRTPRKARTVDDAGNLLPGISAWAHELEEGAAHRGVMNYNFRLTVTRDPAQRVPIPEPRRYDRKRYALLADWMRHAAASGGAKLTDVLDFYRRRNGKLEMNNKQAAVISLGHFGGQFDWPDASYAARARIYEDHLDYTLGLQHFLATDDAIPENVRAEMREVGLHRGEFTDNGNLPHQLYVREARRMRGACVVTQRDVTEDRRKSDAIGISSHFIDCHHVQRVALSPTEFVNEGRIWRKGWAYQIPYRAITPRAEEATNLLVPGAASYSHVAFCTLRLESVWMVTGHAAGVAAAMASRCGEPVQRVDVAAMQQQLREQGQVIDFAEGEPQKCEELNGPPEV